MGCGVGARARMDIREGGKGYFERRFITAISIQLATAVTFAAIGGYIVSQEFAQLADRADLDAAAP